MPFQPPPPACNGPVLKLLKATTRTYTPKMSYSVQYLIVVLDLGQKKSVKYLVKSGADVNAKDANGKSVLMWAGQNGDLKIVKTLIDNGANVHAVDVDGKTALMWSQKQ